LNLTLFILTNLCYSKKQKPQKTLALCGDKTCM